MSCFIWIRGLNELACLNAIEMLGSPLHFFFSIKYCELNLVLVKVRVT